MKWVTRERPKIDRIACPWLITRFIDKDPEFLFVPAPRMLATVVETGAVPYDVQDVELTHVGELCRFYAFLQRYQLTDPALTQLAVISNPLLIAATALVGLIAFPLFQPTWVMVK